MAVKKMNLERVNMKLVRTPPSVLAEQSRQQHLCFSQRKQLLQQSAAVALEGHAVTATGQTGGIGSCHVTLRWGCCCLGPC